MWLKIYQCKFKYDFWKRKLSLGIFLLTCTESWILDSFTDILTQNISDQYSDEEEGQGVEGEEQVGE